MQRMPSRFGFLRTRVARQTLLHFLSAALLPALVSSLVGIWYVRETLSNEAAERVDRTAESAALVLLRQLTSLARETADRPIDALAEVRGMALDGEEAAHLRAGGVLLRLPEATTGRESAVTSDSSDARVMRLLRQSPEGRLGARMVTSRDLWSALDELIDGDRSRLCVFTVRTWERLHCSPTVDDEEEAVLRRIASGRALGVHTSSESDGRAAQPVDDLLVAHRDLYLRFELASPEWRVITAEHRDAALAPASSVTTSLMLLIALAAVGAFAFAHRQIRRDTMPLDALHAATRRVVAGDLQTPVIITSGDEYAELASAFNGMTGTLSRQLSLLQVMDDVDDATLREQNIDAIASIALSGLHQVRGLRAASIAILDDFSELAVSCWTLAHPGGRVQRRAGTFTADERSLLLDNARLLVSEAAREACTRHDGWLPSPDDAARVVLPLINDGELLGAVAIDVDASTPSRYDDALVARRIADRVALGIANVRLVDRLDSLSQGTLLAFARAIDANSPWTAGHSERVTQLAVRLGRQLGLTQSELATLYRGGLMHDIGKIGIPPHVLDKAGRLDDEERALIEKHPEIGERILRPIPAFADALGIVRSHHERYDGTGYPDRLVGESIPWLARILAVADVFDALASDRPYRAGMSHRATMTIIEGNSGTHFDPRVVDALRALEQQSPSALTQHSAMQISMRGGAVRETPHNDMVAVV